MADAENRNRVFEDKLRKSILPQRKAKFFNVYGVNVYIYCWIFMLGYRKLGFHYSTVGVPLLALLINDIWSHWRDKTRLDEIITMLRDENNDLVLSDVNQLPPWLRYPDIDSCSWLNTLILYNWHYVCADVQKRVQKINVSGLKISKVSLGTVPPKIYGVKVYGGKVSNSQLMIDTHLCYSGDSEFSFSYGIGLASFPGGVKNIQLKGPVRIVFLLMERPPFIRGLEFYFLERPQVDFTLTGIGSLWFTEEILRTIIDEELLSRFIFPQPYIAVWNESLEEVLQGPEGVIRINVVEANNLENKDAKVFSKGHSDPYAEVSYGSKTLWSKVVEDSPSPEWDLWCEFVKDNNEMVVIKVIDKDKMIDDLIGTYSLTVHDIENQGQIDSWFKLEGSKGKIHIRACFLHTSSDVNEVEYPPPELSFLSSFILIIQVKSAHNLLLPQSLTKPSSKVQLTVGYDTQESETVKNNDNPAFGQSFTFFVSNPDFNRLMVQVVDVDRKTDIGSFSYSLRKLLNRKDLEIIDEHFPLYHSASDSTLAMSMKLRVINNFFF